MLRSRDQIKIKSGAFFAYATTIEHLDNYHHNPGKPTRIVTRLQSQAHKPFVTCVSDPGRILGKSGAVITSVRGRDGGPLGWRDYGYKVPGDDNLSKDSERHKKCHIQILHWNSRLLKLVLTEAHRTKQSYSSSYTCQMDLMFMRHVLYATFPKKMYHYTCCNGLDLSAFV